jgi:hypothetical protein
LCFGAAIVRAARRGRQGRDVTSACAFYTRPVLPRRRAEALPEHAAQVGGVVQAAGAGDGIERVVCGFEQLLRAAQAQVAEHPHRRRAMGGAERPVEVAGVEVDAAREVVAGQPLAQAGRHERQNLAEAVAGGAQGVGARRRAGTPPAVQDLGHELDGRRGDAQVADRRRRILPGVGQTAERFRVGVRRRRPDDERDRVAAEQLDVRVGAPQFELEPLMDARPGGPLRERQVGRVDHDVAGPSPRGLARGRRFDLAGKHVAGDPVRPRHPGDRQRR